jgi:hypothetical protein
MKTRILFFLATALLSTSCLFAQTTFGLRGGVNFYSSSSKNANGDKSETGLITGFNIGANAEIPVGIDFFIQPGVLYTTKGGKDKDTDNKLVISYIEIPVNFIYKPDLGKGKVLLGFGPYIAFGVGGKSELANGDETDVEFTSEVKQTDPPGMYLKRMDAGANFLFGYEWSNRFSVQLNAGLGLANIYPKIEDFDIGETSIKNTGFGVSVGYRFGK